MLQNAKIGQVKDYLGVSIQTVRNWLDIGEEYFSQHATRRTGKRFLSSDIDQLERIQQHLENGLTYEEIKPLLPFAPVVEIIDDREEQPDQPQVQALETRTTLEHIQEMLRQHRETFQQTIDAKNETIQILQAENSRLREELTQINKPWWKRIF